MLTNQKSPNPACARGEDRATLIRRVLAAEIPEYRSTDRVELEPFGNGLRICYRRLGPESDPADPTFLRLRVDPARGVLWLGHLRIATRERHQGLGRGLVRAAERLARCLGLTRIELFPLGRARRFWRRAGFAPLSGTPKVLGREIAPALSPSLETPDPPRAAAGSR